MTFKKRFSHKNCDPDALKKKLQAQVSGILGIHMKDGEFIDVYSDIEIDATKETQLLNEINSYSYQDPKNKEPKIYDLVSDELKKDNHKNIDYKTQLTSNLYPSRTIVKGEVQKVDWYIDENLTNKVLSVTIVYNRDANGFATDRTTTREWINNDDSVNEDKKVTKKKYSNNHSDQIAEGKRRRGLLVDNLQMPTLGLMLEALLPEGENQQLILLKGRAFMDLYESEFNKFIDNSSTVTDLQDPNFGKKNVVVKLEDTDDVNGFNAGHNYWLDKTPATLGGATIRQYLIGEFSI